MGATTATLNRPFAQASPAELREVIVPEDRELFDEQYRQALDAAAETLTLDGAREVPRALAAYRLVADRHGPREVAGGAPARAEETLRTGESPPGTVSADEMRQRLRARLGRA